MLHERLIKALSEGGPLHRVWPSYSAIGAIVIGYFSHPSDGKAAILIPMFIVAGLLTLYGCLVAQHDHNRMFGRKLVVVGMALMIVSAWTRAIVLWGVSQQGAGSNVLATVVWLWITGGFVMLLISVWTRGLR